MPDKEVVRVDGDDNEPESGSTSGPKWKPTKEAQGDATQFRLIAAALWLVAIGLEAWAIFGVLGKDDVNMLLLIVLIVIIGIFAIGGSLLWKKANRLDPASKEDTVRFFVQNQLGAIISIIAFLPLIILIVTNKNLDPKQKALAGGIGAIVMLAATYIGVDTSPASVEQYTAETNSVTNATGGTNLVYWTKAGKVFHICNKVSDLQRESKDNKIYEGTVAEAHAAGKDRLTLKIAQEQRQCGLTPKPSTPTASATP